MHLGRPLVTYRVIGLGGEAFAVGVVTAAFAVLPLVVAMPLGRLTDRLRSVGAVLGVGGVLLAAGALLMSTAQTLVALALSSAVLGLGQLAFMLAGQAVIARWSSDALLDRAFGEFTAAIAVGQLLGPLLVAVLLGSTTGEALATATRQAFWVAGAVAGLAVPFTVAVACRTPPGAGASGRGAGVRADTSLQLLRRPGVAAGMYASLAILSAIDIVTAYLPLIADQQGVAPAAVGVLLGVRSAATICSRLLLARMLRRWTRECLIVVSAAGSGAALAVVPFPEVGLAGAALGLLAGGFLLGLGQPLTMTLVARAVPDDVRSSALALRMVANRVGQVAVPTLAGVVAASSGAPGAWWLSCAVLGSAAVVSRRAAPSALGL